MAITTPPFRTALLTQNGVPFGSDSDSVQTTKDWWLYWNQLTDRSNSNSKLATAGTHGDRPMPDGMPDGALYYENDRGVLYASTLGVWQYVAGTMYGTLSPVDERPTDLGTHDAGFDFRTIVAPAREFLWSQAEWIEVTPVQYGPHSARPDPTTIVEGALYVEGDRGGVIYQVENPAGTPLWQYLAGTMWGTLSPDQRPTDLGVHDAGFDFRTVAAPPREFIWAQVAWVEVTPVGGAINLTHPNVVTKVGSTGQIVEGGITDLSASNSNTVYITAAGNVGLSQTNPTASLHAFRSDGSYQVKLESPLHLYGIALTSTGGLTIDDLTVLAPRFTLASNGNVGIGTPGPGYLLQVNLDSAGKPATSTWSVVSDIRLKQNMEPVKDDSLAIVAALNWVRYEYNGKANTPGGLKAIGLVAQALQEQLPEAVRSSKTKLNEADAAEADVLAIDYHHILVHSARAIQQLDAELKSLKALLGKPLE